MNEAARFLVRPNPLAGESWRGYLLRLAERNGLAPTVDLRLVNSRHEAIGGVAEAWVRQQYVNAGVTPVMPRLRGSSIQHGIGEVRFGSQAIAPGHVRYHRCAVCPHCIRATGAVRATWELNAVTVCVDHACWLVDQCPTCDASIRWRRPGVRLCRCGHDLSSTQTADAPPEVVALTAWIEQLVWNDLGDALAEFPAVADHLKAISLAQALSMFRLFAKANVFAHLPRVEASYACSERLRDNATVALNIARMFSAWPGRFHELCGRMANTRFRSEASNSPILVTESEAKSPFSAFERTGRGPLDNCPKFITHEFQRFLKTRRVEVEYRRFYRLKDDDAAEHRDRSERHHLRSLRGITAPFRDYRFSAAAVRQIVGGTEHQLKLLESDAVLRRQRWTATSELDGAMHRLAGKAKPRRWTHRASMIAIGDFSRSSGHELIDLLRGINEGQLQCFTWSHVRPAGLPHIWLLQEEVERWRIETRRQRRLHVARQTSD